ncbi:uncharacterized protein LOC108732258 [Agrilus planipennis]|uniref:Uncharacterized protein LOC108732258 n=1 Tax=Agrilus planipennis TaxID=224129 RepID=A0A1W4WDC2_AGRPL|nr:uncharacterized protein LOC108732258 [Agrilus planipennis]
MAGTFVVAFVFVCAESVPPASISTEYYKQFHALDTVAKNKVNPITVVVLKYYLDSLLNAPYTISETLQTFVEDNMEEYIEPAVGEICDMWMDFAIENLEQSDLNESDEEMKREQIEEFFDELRSDFEIMTTLWFAYLQNTGAIYDKNY